MRRAARRDDTEPAIVDRLRELGYLVNRQALPDLIVRDPRTKLIHLLEVEGGKRTGTGKRRPEQLEFLRAWEVPIVKTLDEALHALGARVL